MKDWTPEQVALAAHAELLRPPFGEAATTRGPLRAEIDSRSVRPGDLFVGIAGERVDGGEFAPEALAAGAWGVLVTEECAAELGAAALMVKSSGPGDHYGPGAILAAPDPVVALGQLARARRRQLGATTIAITGSTGKTSTKDILAALLAPHRRTHASPQNRNTEIGLPLAILEAPEGTEVLVLELAMRGREQIAELTAICEPDVGVIVNVGPVHLELLGTIEAIAAAKAELIRDMPAGGTVIVPANERLLDSHRRADIDFVTFGATGDVHYDAADQETGGEEEAVTVLARGTRLDLELPFNQAYNRRNALAAIAAAQAAGVEPAGRVEVSFSALRGELIELPGAVTVINDCYNANPMSMRAALDDLAARAPGRRVAVLGDMLELGAEERSFHQEVGRQASARGVGLLIAVGERAAAMTETFEGETVAVPDADAAATVVSELIEPGDTVLVKASRGVGLEIVAERLREHAGEGS
jgi:UDP-N-acetylmuramoyl-tripeptide--D-alanyl-D-alanine ligase